MKKPAFLDKIQYILDSLGYLDKAYERYGENFKAPIIENNLFLISNPETLQQIFTRDSQDIAAPRNPLLGILTGDKSIFMLDGAEHRRERKLLMPPFHGEGIFDYCQLIWELTENAMASLTPGTSFIARDVMQSISIGVILKAVFGIEEQDRFQELKQSMATLVNSLQSPLISSLLYLPALRKDFGPNSPWRYFQNCKKNIDRLIYQEIRERRQEQDSSGKKDILALLMSVEEETGAKMTDEELHDELLTLLLAGYETTATAMSWGIYWIHRFPKVREKLRQELEELGETQEPTAIIKLPYLTAVCNESLRIIPVTSLTFPRLIIKPIELGGEWLEQGTTVRGCIYLTHRREDLYPDADQFKPERFLERKYSPYEFMPFGGGIRRCLGDVLALLEMKLVLAKIISSYQLALVDQEPVKPKRRGVIVAPGDGVKMIFQGGFRGI